MEDAVYPEEDVGGCVLRGEVYVRGPVYDRVVQEQINQSGYVRLTLDSPVYYLLYPLRYGLSQLVVVYLYGLQYAFPVRDKDLRLKTCLPPYQVYHVHVERVRNHNDYLAPPYLERDYLKLPRRVPVYELQGLEGGCVEGEIYELLSSLVGYSLGELLG